MGKIAFWSSLFAITYLQLNKLNKLISLYFYDEEKNTEHQLKLKLDNILLFRDSLVKKNENFASEGRIAEINKRPTTSQKINRKRNKRYEN